MTRPVRLIIALALAAGCANVSVAQTPPSTVVTPTVAITATDPGLSGQLGNEDPLYIKLTYRSEQPVNLRAEGEFRGQTVPDMSGNTVMQLSGTGEALVSMAYPAGAKVDTIKINVFDDRWRPLTSTEAPADLAWTTAPPRDPSGYAEWVIPLKQIDDQRARWLAVTSPSTWLAYATILSVPAYLALQVWLGIAWTGRWRWAAFIPLLLTLPALAITVLAIRRGANLAPMPILLAAPPALFYLLIAWVLHRAMRRPAAD